jgi:hypothetical protein
MLDITTLAAWGEFLGGIAVVVSLIYLASQIRQNSRLLRVSTTAAVAASDIEFSKLLVNDPDLSRIVGEGLMNREALPEPERLRFDNFLDMMLRTFQRDYFFAQDGAIKESIWQGERKGYAYTFQQPGARQWWAEALDIYGDEFRDYLEACMREGEAAE